MPLHAVQCVYVLPLSPDDNDSRPKTVVIMALHGVQCVLAPSLSPDRRGEHAVAWSAVRSYTLFLAGQKSFSSDERWEHRAARSAVLPSVVSFCRTRRVTMLLHAVQFVHASPLLSDQCDSRPKTVESTELHGVQCVLPLSFWQHQNGDHPAALSAVRPCLASRAGQKSFGCVSRSVSSPAARLCSVSPQKACLKSTF